MKLHREAHEKQVKDLLPQRPAELPKKRCSSVTGAITPNKNLQSVNMPVDRDAACGIETFTSTCTFPSAKSATLAEKSDNGGGLSCWKRKNSRRRWCLGRAITATSPSQRCHSCLKEMHWRINFRQINACPINALILSFSLLFYASLSTGWAVAFDSVAKDLLRSVLI